MCVCVTEMLCVTVQGVSVFNVRLEQGGDAQVLQVNKRRIEKWKGKGGLWPSLTSGPPLVASDISSLVPASASFHTANTVKHFTVYHRPG